MPRPSTEAFALGASGLLATGWLVRHSKAPVVRSWRPGAGHRGRLGPLSVRQHGEGVRSYVLMHGLLSSADIFGHTFDALGQHGRVFAVDLLGFGKSFDGTGSSFDLDAHLEALDRALADAGNRIVFGAHSLGALLALHWASRNPGRVERIVTWGAPLYTSPAEAHRRMASMGPVQALFTSDGPLPRVLNTGILALHPEVLLSAVAAAMPQLPAPLAHTLVEHSWQSYRQSMEILLDNDWQQALKRLAHASVPVLLAHGARDKAVVPGRAAAYAGSLSTVDFEVAPSIRHEMVLTDPARCLRHLQPA